MTKFYSLQIVRIQSQTDLAKEITFEIPPELKEKFKYKLGQHLSLKFYLNGEEVRRSYSLCSSTDADKFLKINVQRVADEWVSNHIHDNVKTGDKIEVMTSVQAVANAKLKARLRGKNISLTIKEGRTILKTLLYAGKEPPYSCEGGVCGTCVCKVTKGSVQMKKNLALSEEEVKQGLVLSCQSVPLSEKIEIVF